MSKIYILGGSQSDFAINWHKQQLTLTQMMTKTLNATFEQSKFEAELCDSVHIGNFAGELFNQQGLLAGVAVTAEPAFYNKAILRYEAACASGSMAILGAIAQIRAGMSQAACVLGVEQMRNVDAKIAAQHLGSAVWNGQECADVAFPWPHLFGQLGQQYQNQYGLDYQHLSYLSKLAYDNARCNPNAQTRAWQMPESKYGEQPENPVIDGMIRRSDCAQVTDGCVAVILANEQIAKTWAVKVGISLSQVPVIKGFGHTTAPIGFNDKLRFKEQLLFPHIAHSINTAFQQAKINHVFDLDAIETHDCFSTTFYMAIDHFSVTKPGENYRAIEQGWLEKNGKLPFNPSGGLIGLGHPVGATGVRQLLDCYLQVTGQANDCQVENASNVAMLNLGGSATTSACFVVGRTD